MKYFVEKFKFEMYAKWNIQCSTLLEILNLKKNRIRNDEQSQVNEWFENCILAKLKLFSFSILLFLPQKFLFFFLQHFYSHDDLLSLPQ